MANPSHQCTGIASNPDLVGIGTRVNFYATIFLAAVIPRHRYTTDLLDSLYINAIFYGLALLITVLVQTIQGQLDLYHAIFVIHILSCFILFQHHGLNRFILASANKDALKLRITVAVQVLIYIIFGSWSIYVWVKASQFGAQPECNDLVKYVFFFITVRATVGWLRTLFVVTHAMSVLISLANLVMTMFDLYCVPGNSMVDSDLELEERSSRAVLWLVVNVLCAVVGVAATELMVHRNRPHVQTGENDWGFGQIVSIIMILPVVLETLVVFKKWYLRLYEGRDSEVAPMQLPVFAVTGVGPET
ncbi:hypothetical protein EDB85DRAFT_1889202 [Lactarius pseudohatsudake]|nr:hypothetical protein EDB85DRAFT_1889202 [Lactarius pseudohatsudake]